jgi:nitroimidazol reductase NimA-like FMN-containing flavoprotein (pyridoxamine 5'-phosphate oxidase superfamily)
MARLPESLRLSGAEIDALMRSETRLRIATLGPGAEINLTPMTFAWAGGCVYIYGRGQKIANLRRNPTASVLVDAGERWRELKGVMLRGRARVLENAEQEAADPHLGEAQRDLGRKHGLERDGAPAPYAASAAGRSRRWIVFSPTAIVSWNNARLP